MQALNKFLENWEALTVSQKFFVCSIMCVLLCTLYLLTPWDFWIPSMIFSGIMAITYGIILIDN